MANPPYPLHALRGDRWGSWGLMFPRVDGYEPVPTTLDFCVMPVQSGRKQVLLRLQRGTGEPALGRAPGRARAKRTCCRAAAGTACSCHLGGRRSACSLMWAWTSGSARRRPAPHAAGKSITRSTRHDVRRGKGQSLHRSIGEPPTPRPKNASRENARAQGGPRPRGRPQDAHPEWTRAQRPHSLSPRRHTIAWGAPVRPANDRRTWS